MNISPINYSMNYNYPKKTNKLNVETAGSIGMVKNQASNNNPAFKGNIVKQYR